MDETAERVDRGEARVYLERLVAEHLNLVYSAALRQVGNPQVAEDVTQSVFLVAAKKSGQLPRERAAAWLMKVTRYAALTALRADRRRRRHERAAAIEASETMRSQTPEESFKTQLDEALSALRESDRELIVLRFLENWSVPEVAALLEIAENTAAKRIQRAMEKLRIYFERRGVTLGAASLAAILVDNAVRPAPAALGARILEGSNISSASAIAAHLPLGTMMMIASMKAKIILFALILGVMSLGTFAVMQVMAGDAAPGNSHAAATQPRRRIFNDPVGTTTLTGLVTDANGIPLENILVSQGDAVWMSGYRTTRTDANGEFVLRKISIGQNLVLAAQGKGFAPGLQTGLITANPDPFTFTLSPGKSFQVKVIDERGLPVSKLIVDPREWRKTFVIETSTYKGGVWDGPVTDANGIFVWKNAPADPVTFDVIPPEQYLRKEFTLSASPQLQTVTLRDAIRVSVNAVDAQSKAAIPAFKVFSGYGSEQKPDFWYESTPASGAGGKFSGTISWSHPMHFFRVEAAGYAPVIQPLGEDQNPAVLNFSLTRQAVTSATILAPDGKPAAKAEVYLIPPTSNFTLQQSQMFHDGRFPPGQTQSRAKSDNAGQVSIDGAKPDGTRLVAIHESGFADVLLADALKSPVSVKAWANVKGTAMIGSKPVSRGEIMLSFASDHREPFISGDFTVKTDAEGHFAFKRIPPGVVGIARWVETNMGSQFQQGAGANSLAVTLAPGSDVEVTLGGKGRPVVGKIVGPDSNDLRNAVYSLGQIQGGTGGPQPQLSPELQEKMQALRKLSVEQRRAGFAALREQMQSYEKAVDEWAAKRKFLSCVVSPDGSFRADDIETGDYSLSVGVTDGKSLQPLGSATTRFSVPPMPEGRSDDPLDIGDLPVHPAH